MNNSLCNAFHGYICEFQQRLVDKLASYDSPSPKPSGNWTAASAEIKDSSGNAIGHSEHLSRSYVFPDSPATSKPFRNIERAGVFVYKVAYNYVGVPQSQGISDGFEAFDGADSRLTPKPIPLFRSGISTIINPRRPRLPSASANFFYFEDHREGDPTAVEWRFVGGCDLTPSYVNEEDFRKFHTTLKAVCEKFPFVKYEALKTACDKRFYIPHRDEYRGIGGIYFALSSLRLPNTTPQEVFAFVKASAEAFFEAYGEIIDSSTSSGLELMRERRWQLARQGRSAEWTLVNSDGFLNGLYKVPADRHFAVLPETLRFEHDSDFEIMMTDPEKEMQEILKNPRDWTK